MDIVDIVIVILVAAAIFRGKEIGSIRQIFSTVGFLLGLFIGSLISPLFVPLGHTAVSRGLLTLLIMLGSGLAVLSISEYLGELLKIKLARHKVDVIDRGFGSLISIVTILATVWLGAAVLIKLPYPGLQSEIRGSAIISTINGLLPPAPRLISDLGRLINPNGFPEVFSGNEPTPQSATLPSLGQLQAAVSKDQASVVKIEGRGCGGIVEGSGFIAGQQLVITNAHVVAGVAHPYVSSDDRRLAATPIWFDPNLDLAVLHVSGLNGTILNLDTATVSANTPAAVLGYPGGGSFDAEPATVLDEFTADGRNIYNQGSTTRQVYEVKATVVPGNSGGPLIDENGTVVGVVFAQSTTYNQVGYALTSPPVAQEFQQAKTRTTAISTGRCAE